MHAVRAGKFRQRCLAVQHKSCVVTVSDRQKPAQERNLFVRGKSFSRKLTQRQPADSAALTISASGRLACSRSVTRSKGGSGSRIAVRI